MYFFNPEDFNCNEIPTTEKWVEYCDTLKALFDNYKTCFKNWYAAQDKDLLGDSCKSQIAIAYNGWLGRVSSYNSSLNALIAEIESLSSVTTCGFNQNGLVVIHFKRTMMIFRRGKAPQVPRPNLITS